MSKETIKDTLTLDVKELARRPWSIDIELPAKWLEGVLASCEYPLAPEGGRCRLEAELISEDVRITGQVDLVAATECATCLNQVTLNVKVDVDTYMRPADKDDSERDEYTPEDLEYEFYEGSKIELTELISDGILIELPMNPRCDGPCRKVEHLVTADELEQQKPAIDPRLQALADPSLRRRIKSGSSKEENI